jgi:hypothetical protein
MVCVCVCLCPLTDTHTTTHSTHHSITPVTMTSKYFGLRMSCIAALSMYMWLSSTSG